jgi:ribosomal protein L11 methylase PrmA
MKTLDMGCGTAILAILAEMKALNQLMLLILTIGVI